ncbi:MAG: hypothetical protein COX70_08440 [Flavobacteriales bacterium CG_4_10_14_0_2_um_filter_32_8]|nr:MAG: hypothetical protein COX70_08440 [Flavobacteriales bacterium CG_4_10_14_0_2_um_filter_32_8]
MNKIALLLLFFTINFTSFCQTIKEEKVETRKLTYNDFVSDYSINDTSAVIIDIFFDKKDNAGFGEMSFLPITVVLAAIPQTRMIGIGTTLVSLPLFLHGSYTLLKYRNKKLYTVLVDYKKTKTLPKWVRRKANKLLDYYDTMQPED